ncbi:MAG: flavin reductase family protein [Brevibacterium yomogidense]|uniref:NADH-FMN oxidoreductase RutF, flavin reductase (DIM6/NTAB) family n=2 Tax=Brevibacterium TaxID=1696 RepID=A0A2H1L5C2_9MICO|nr:MULTISPECIES: flavin reductase family protein [Brevibacterium]TWC01445.1 flavin reductase (DIM6/NTAB) family NADH-FMN oxidoreductase RutF [Brevibacterium jeotgali]SLM90738.1 Nitrilotriacetate monooxygenase component B [Brevibacterium yomogidense]SMX82657.1 NADH-FMN oxidoreductase RutF, flavin reductase (DIM6/NTAB) family [Brevibacterium sp. Mu109]SMY11950.1 NADH-FMN oxidoreductase RutF, flavin reductase (DIM6/NTAB) family [Brevibacterium jeotgali]
MRPQRTEFEPIALGDRETTLLMKSILIPRPIAWVGTTDDAGVANLAPHSFFTMVSETPPVVMFSSTGRKDTLANAEATGEFTVSLVSRPQFEEANQTSAGYAPEVSEFEAAAVAQEPSAVVAPPRVASSPAVMECTVERIIPVGDSFMVLGRVVHVAVDTRTLSTDARGRTLPLAQDLDPLARLGRNEWGSLGDVLSAPRPHGGGNPQ